MKKKTAKPAHSHVPAYESGRDDANGGRKYGNSPRACDCAECGGAYKRGWDSTLKFELEQEVLVNICPGGVPPRWVKGVIATKCVMEGGIKPPNPVYLVEHKKNEFIFRHEDELRDPKTVVEPQQPSLF